MITQEYEYDPIGNRLNYWEGDPTDNATELTSYAPNSLNQYDTLTPHSSPAITQDYDDDGNLQDDGIWTYTWNTENRLTQITKQNNTTQLRFIYDGLGRRIQKEVYAGDGSGAQSSWTLLELNQFIYDGWNMIAQLDTLNPSAPTVHSTYTWGLDLSGSPQGAGGVGGLLSVVDKTGSTHLPTYDSNGNVMGYFQTDTETLVAEYEYGPFGELIRATGNKKDEFNFRFSTKYEDAETGLLYYGYRYYDAVTGRWLNRDPIGENGGLNLYGMVGNDGINRWDYLGLDWCDDVAAFLPTMQAGLAEGEQLVNKLRNELGLPALSASVALASGARTAYGLAAQEGVSGVVKYGGLEVTDSRGPVRYNPVKLGSFAKGLGYASVAFDGYSLATAGSAADRVTSGVSLGSTGVTTYALSTGNPVLITGASGFQIGFALGQIPNAALEKFYWDPKERQRLEEAESALFELNATYNKLSDLFSDKCGCFVGNN